MTAKYWGRGPRVWTPSLINFKSFGGHPIPSSLGGRTDQVQISSSLLATGTTPQIANPHPTQLCRWSIHSKVESASTSSESSDESEGNFDIDDESTWAEWNTEEASRTVESTIQEGLRQNTFSAVQPENLPFDVNSIVEAVQRSPNQSKVDALGFAIMSRNRVAVRKILYNDEDSFEEELTAIYPFHLAASFLDGGKTCCSIMDVLLSALDGSTSIGVNYTDKSGLTVLDALFVTIIRSHTVPSQALGDTFNSQIRYPGQDVDTCGRWDADSPCIRHLHASGEQAIPHQWKHMFCHTSVQAVCHTILAIFGYVWRPNIDTPSGLFRTRCVHCGLELKVGPLHALILTAFLLADNGLPGENLFGIIACLVCLLTLRADPRATAAISIPMLLEHDPQNECQHPEMNPVDLASTLLQRSHNKEWTPEAILGWKMMIAILQQDVTKPRDKSSESDADLCCHDIHEEEEQAGMKLVHCGNERLGMIFACIQAELLTYRRLSEWDPWLSPRFNMEVLLRGMENDDENDLKILVGDSRGTKESILREYSCCGLFRSSEVSLRVRRGEACTSYYANLDDWRRTTFLAPPEW